jgi:hypothetical protein
MEYQVGGSCETVSRYFFVLRVAAHDMGVWMNNFNNGFSGAKQIHFYFQNKMLKTNQLIITALLASIAAVFQSAGVFFMQVY